MGELSFEYIYSILKSVVGLMTCPLDSFLIVVYLTLCLSGSASSSVSYCSTKHQSTEENCSNPRGGKKSEIQKNKRKAYKPYLGFHSKQIPYPTYKIWPKKLATVHTLNHQATEKFTVDFLLICGATGSCCDKTHKSMTDIWINLSIMYLRLCKGWTLKFLSMQLWSKKRKEKKKVKPRILLRGRQITISFLQSRARVGWVVHTDPNLWPNENKLAESFHFDLQATHMTSHVEMMLLLRHPPIHSWDNREY